MTFTTPQGRTVYGGGGIIPDVYISNDDSPKEAWDNYFIRSNFVNRFVFSELDTNNKAYSFNNAPKFYNESLPFKKEFLKSFGEFSKENNIPFKISNEEKVLNSIKAYIAIQLFGENMFNRIINQKDPYILKALEEIESN